MKRILLALLFLPLTAHADQLFQHSSTSNIVRIFIEDTSKTGTDASIGLTGVAYNTSGLELHHICDVDSADTDYTVAGSTIEDITTLGTFAAPTATKVRFKAVDGTDMPGVYEVQLADARFAVSNARSCILSWKGVTNMRAGFKEIPLLAAAPTVDVTKWNGTAVATPDTAGYPKITIKDGTGTGEVDTNSGAVVSVTTAATCSALGSDSISSATIAADAIGASELAADAIGASEIAASAIGASELASDAIGAAEIAADAIGASELAADATTEIAAGSGSSGRKGQR